MYNHFQKKKKREITTLSISDRFRPFPTVSDHFRPFPTVPTMSDRSEIVELQSETGSGGGGSFNELNHIIYGLKGNLMLISNESRSRVFKRILKDCKNRVQVKHFCPFLRHVLIAFQ
jgi:hypothetical protein